MMSTYLSENEFTEKVSNLHLQELLNKVNKIEQKYRLEEIVFKTGIIRKKYFKTYNVYYEIGYPEFQLINFYNENSEDSINTEVSADIVSAYFYGILRNKK